MKVWFKFSFIPIGGIFVALIGSTIVLRFCVDSWDIRKYKFESLTKCAKQLSGNIYMN